MPDPAGRPGHNRAAHRGHRYIAGHTAGQEAPTPAEAAAFVADYEDSRADSFTSQERAVIAAATTCVLAYNARCNLSFLPPGTTAPEGSRLWVLARNGSQYLLALISD